jgi:hypothetical protein
VLVGRAPVVAALRQAFAAAGTGRGRLVLLGGEPGIGKTALATDLADHAAGAGATVVWGVCVAPARTGRPEAQRLTGCAIRSHAYRSATRKGQPEMIDMKSLDPAAVEAAGGAASSASRPPRRPRPGRAAQESAPMNIVLRAQP